MHWYVEVHTVLETVTAHTVATVNQHTLSPVKKSGQHEKLQLSVDMTGANKMIHTAHTPSL